MHRTLSSALVRLNMPHQSLCNLEIVLFLASEQFLIGSDPHSLILTATQASKITSLQNISTYLNLIAFSPVSCCIEVYFLDSGCNFVATTDDVSSNVTLTVAPPARVEVQGVPASMQNYSQTLRRNITIASTVDFVLIVPFRAFFQFCFQYQASAVD
jgi:hypothetical protein